MNNLHVINTIWLLLICIFILHYYITILKEYIFISNGRFRGLQPLVSYKSDHKYPTHYQHEVQSYLCLHITSYNKETDYRLITTNILFLPLPMYCQSQYTVYNRPENSSYQELSTLRTAISMPCNALCIPFPNLSANCSRHGQMEARSSITKHMFYSLDSLL